MPESAADKAAVAKVARKLAAADRRRKAREARDEARQAEARDKSNGPKRAKADDFKKRRSEALADTSSRSTIGKQIKLQRAGFIPGGVSFKEPKGPLGLAAKTVGNLAEAAVYTPAGLVEAGKAVGKDTAATRKGDLSFKRSRELGKAIAVQTKDTVRHPLRRPGDTLLLGFAAASGGAGAVSRASAASRTVRTGGGIKKALIGKPHEGGSLLRAPQPGKRILRSGDLEVRGLESRNKLVAAVERQIDKRSGGQASPKRVGRELNEELRITEALERAPMATLADKARRLTKPQETAIRVVAEGKPIRERIAFHERQRDAAKGQRRRDHTYKTLLLKAAERYVDDSGETPKFRDDFKAPRGGGGVLPRKGAGPAELADVYARAGKVAGDRQATLEGVGALDPAQSKARVSAPGRVIEGARMETQKEATKARGVRPQRARVEQVREYPARSKTVTRPRTADEARARLDELDAGTLTETIPGKPRKVHLREQAAVKGVKAKPRLAGAEDFAGGDFRIPYTSQVAPRAHEGTPQFRGGPPKAPTSTKKPFTGGLLRSGNFRDDAARQVAESGVEAQRYAGALRLRDRLLEGASDEPFEGGVPIKTDDLANKPYPPAVAHLLAKTENGAKLSKTEQKYLGKQYDRIVQELGLDPDNPIDAVEGVKWISQDLLAELHRQGAPLRALLGNKATDAIDAVNNFSRLAIFYTKPGYVPPNVVGNALLNLNQQGASAVPNLIIAGKRSRALSQDALQALDAVMGEGIIGSLGGGHAGAPLASTANRVAGALGKVTDRRFRRNAFFYEARQSGHGTKEQMQALLTDPKLRDDLIEVAKRANREVIDYGRLGKREQEIVRRALFVYPFLKGSTMYTGRFVQEHPIKAAGQAQLALQGKEAQEDALGNVPSYAEGLVSLGGNKVANTAGVGLFNAPAQLARTAGDFASGRNRSAYRLSEMLTPAASLGLAAVTQRDSFTGRALKGPKDVGKTLVDSFPQKQLYDRLTRDEEAEDNRVYPYSDKDALLAYGLGSIAPRPVNREALNEQAAREDDTNVPPEQRAYRKVFKVRNDLFRAAREKMPEALEGGRLPKKLRAAFNIEAERQALYARASQDKQEGTAEYHLARYEVDLRILVKHGLVPKERAEEVLANARTASYEDLKDARRQISERYYQAEGGQLYFISHAKKALREKGVEVG